MLEQRSQTRFDMHEFITLYLHTQKRINLTLTAVFLFLIRLYRQWISPVLGPRCRFIPSCSAYGIEAVTKHGPWKGGWLTLKRLSKCHPFTPCGCDPVPEK